MPTHVIAVQSSKDFNTQTGKFSSRGYSVSSGKAERGVHPLNVVNERSIHGTKAEAIQAAKEHAGRLAPGNAKEPPKLGRNDHGGANEGSWITMNGHHVYVEK